MRALDPLPVAIADVGALARQHDPVALLEIGDAVGERRERERVGTQIHLAVAVADRERRALARPDQQVVLALEQIDERESAAQALSAACTASLGVLPSASSSSTTNAAISESVSVANA